MAYVSLYRKWRPQVFEDVVEQEHVVRTLRNAVITGRIAHAYLFCGTRGTGKTTMAKIFSRAINCLDPQEGDPCNRCEICRGILSGSILDVIEIDAASNNSVDNVREIRDEVVYSPSHARYKVYIIDEVHMLSSGAFNALLKTLEEPPPHVVFILATTEPHRLPATILSRCQRFDFRRITVDSIIKRLEKIAESNGVILQKEAARLIARLADGALRDAISILDQCMAAGSEKIEYNDVLSVVGIVNDFFIAEVVDAVREGDIAGIFRLVERLVMDGKDVLKFAGDLVQYFRNMLICKVVDSPQEIVEVSEETLEKMKTQCQGFDKNELIMIIRELSSLETDLRWAVHPRVLLEAGLVRICERGFNAAKEDIMVRLDILEKKLASGNFTVVPSAAGTGTGVEAKANAGFNSDQETAGHEDYEDLTHEGTDARTKAVQDPEEMQETGEDKGTTEPEDMDAVKTIKDLRELENWNEILDKLRSQRRMILYSNLLNARAVCLSDRMIGLVFDEENSFSRILVSKAENLEILESLLSQELGREIRVKCLNEREAIEQRGNEGSGERDELIEKAEDMARRFDAPLNIIDE